MDPPGISRSHNNPSDDQIQWTDEKHKKFLNSMEAWFVRTMLEGTGRLLRLDRHLPDSSESSLDSKLVLDRGKRNAVSVNFMGTNMINGRPVKRLRRSFSQPYDSSEDDQVVPQIDFRGGVKDDRGVVVASMVTPASTI